MSAAATDYQPLEGTKLFTPLKLGRMELKHRSTFALIPAPPPRSPNKTIPDLPF